MLLLGRNKVEGQIRPTGRVFATCVVQYVLGHFPPPNSLFISREGEREGEKHQYVVVSRAPPTGDLARNPGMYPDWESNQ